MHYNQNLIPMRIFISTQDSSGNTKTTRLLINENTNTNTLLKQISKEIGISKSDLIVKLKYEPYPLRIIDNWPISHYPFKNGSILIVDFNQKYSCVEQNESTQILDRMAEQVDDYSPENEFSSKLSSTSEKYEIDDFNYLEQQLSKMLSAVLDQDLEKISQILNEQPHIQDEQQLSKAFQKKYNYLLNNIGDSGRNALHWAIHKSNIDIVSFLIIKGANPTILTIDDYTPLQLSVLYHSPDIMKLLLEQKKTDINQLTSKGTALILAVKNEDIKCLEMLLQNEVDIQVIDNQGKTAVDYCKVMNIKKMLFRKNELKNMKAPNITKGNVYRVTGMTYRLKEKIIILNPFSNELKIQKSSNEVQDKFEISVISNVEEISQKNWLMKDRIFYFRIIFQQKKEIVLGTRHDIIGKKWIESLKQAKKYVQNSIYHKLLPIREQLIEVLDDQHNKITLHKRKVEQSRKTRPEDSILNLPVEDQNKKPYQQSNLIYSEVILSEVSEAQIERKSHSSGENDIKRSEIILGSIVEEQFGNSRSKSKYQPKTEDITFSTLEQPITEFSNQRFRKNSDSRYQMVSEFKSDQKQINISYRDFQVVKLIGNGAFGLVYIAKYKKSGKTYALKILNKKKLIKNNQLKYAVGQTNILKKVDHPLIIKLYYAFQTPLHLYLALDYCLNGDLSEIIMVKQRLCESTAKFVIAQVILAVEYLHNQNIIYRDMKPQNILIGRDGYIRLTDFGLSKEKCFSMSFCGSPAYLSPQMLEKKGVGFQNDIYGIGCVLFEMVTGDPPYFDDDLDTFFKNIKSGKLLYPSYLSIQIKSLISRLLERDPTKRIGAKNIKQIKQHDFFKKMNWGSIENKKVNPPPQMFINQQQQRSNKEIDLQKKEQITLVDDDYDASTSMINRIRNFTFVRQILTSPNKREN